MEARSTEPEVPASVLVVEDDDDLRDVIARFLERAGFVVATASTGAEAVEVADDVRPDIVVLDVGLPDRSGYEVMTALRESRPLPILLLTGRDAPKDRVFGLDRGADDYLVKPASLHELAARVRALLRRQPPMRELVVGDVVVDVRRRMVTRDDTPVHLTRLELDLLVYLLQRPGAVVDRAEILERVWHSSTEFQSVAVITEYMTRLRRKLGDLPIVNVRGIGYRYDPPPTGGSGSSGDT